MHLQHVTVVIPAKNESDHILSCIKSLQDQDYDKNLVEVILVDNGSTDNTAILAAQAEVRVLPCPTGNIGYVRNFGAEAGSGEIIAYIDADCEAPREWVSSLVILLRREGIGAVGGYINAPVDGNWVEQCWALKKSEIEKVTNILATGSFALLREVFEKVGGFNGTVVAGEDTDISRRIIATGRSLLLSPSMSVVHNGYPKTIWQFLKRQIWQSSDYLRSRKHGIDPIFIATNIFLVSLLAFLAGIFFSEWQIVWLCFLVCISLACFLGVFRVVCSAESFTFMKLINVILLNYIYLLGRAIGLLKSYLSFFSTNL